MKQDFEESIISIGILAVSNKLLIDAGETTDARLTNSTLNFKIDELVENHKGELLELLKKIKKKSI